MYQYIRLKLPKQQSKLIPVPWDSAKESRKSWVLRKDGEQIRFSRCSKDNSSFTVQKGQERTLTLQSFQARDTYRKLIENGYKLGR